MSAAAAPFTGSLAEAPSPLAFPVWAGNHSATVLTCLPQSLCSWDFRVLGTAASPAELIFNFFTEQGGILLGPNYFTIQKHGPLSGRWTLEQGGQIISEARKPNAFFRSFEVSAGDLHLTVQVPLTRSYEIRSGGRMVGTIRPAHPLTRRAFIECSPEVPELSQLFAFWLAAITWRRAANSNK